MYLHFEWEMIGSTVWVLRLWLALCYLAVPSIMSQCAATTALNFVYITVLMKPPKSERRVHFLKKYQQSPCVLFFLVEFYTWRTEGPQWTALIGSVVPPSCFPPSLPPLCTPPHPHPLRSSEWLKPCPSCLQAQVQPNICSSCLFILSDGALFMC